MLNQTIAALEQRSFAERIRQAKARRSTGFVASEKRSALTLLKLAAPLPFPIKVVGSSGERAALLVKTARAGARRTADAQLLAAAAADVRSMVGA